MYISNITHFLDETGNIPKKMNKEGRELASFLTLLIDESTRFFPEPDVTTEIRCFEKKCDGKIITELRSKNDEIHWKCSICQNAGRISAWQNTKWDNIADD